MLQRTCDWCGLTIPEPKRFIDEDTADESLAKTIRAFNTRIALPYYTLKLDLCDSCANALEYVVVESKRTKPVIDLTSPDYQLWLAKIKEPHDD